MSRRFSINIDAVAIDGVANTLADYGNQVLGRSSLQAVNEVTQRAYIEARAKMNRGINLTDAYLQSKMEFRAASNAVRPIASIIANGDLTNLISYRPKQLSTVVRFTNATIRPFVGKFGENPRKPGTKLPWKLRTGAPALGIPVDRKQAGQTVEVTTGAPKVISYAFVIRAHGQAFVATRRKDDHHGKGKVVARTGPSVYQLFRYALDDSFLVGVQTNLSKAVVDVTAADLRKALG